MIVNAPSYADTFDFSFPISTGTEEFIDPSLVMSKPLNIYPNPCQAMIRINLNRAVLSRLDNMIRIYDVSGLLVREYDIADNTDLIAWAGDDYQGKHLPGGVYFVKFTSPDLDKTYKVVFLR
jgi:hypothetical protein